MSWINQISLFVLLMGAASLLIGLIWLVFYEVIYTIRRPDFVYLVLRITIAVLVLVPIVGYAYAVYASYFLESNFYFIFSKSIADFLKRFFGVWISGCIILLMRFLLEFVEFKQQCKNAFFVSLRCKERFELVKSKLGVKKDILLLQSYGIMSPFICGITRPRIYLPCDDFSDDELDMIFTHELYHCKQGDTFWKPSLVVLCIFLWYNPLVWIMKRQMVRWSEASCDYRCCRQAFDCKLYYGSICKLSDKSTGFLERLAPMWTEGTDELIWRMNCMKKYKNVVLKKKTLALLLSVAVGVGSMSVSAAGKSLEEAYNDVLLDTLTYVDETDLVEEQEYDEHTMTIDDLDGYTIIYDTDSGISAYSGSKTFNWSMGPNVTCGSTNFYVGKGGTISVAGVISPGDKMIKVGIVASDGTIRYIMTSGSFSYDFSISKSDRYRVIMINGNSVTVSAVGGFTY